MNKQLQNALATILNKAIAAGDFAIEQAPDVVRQLLTYNFVLSLLWFLAALVFFAGYTFGTYKFTKWLKSEGELSDVAGAVVFMLVVGMAITLAMSSLTWLKIWLAPKIFILEYAAALVK